MTANKTFDTLTEDLIEILASYLEPLDMLNLGASCKHLYKSISRPEIWEQYVHCLHSIPLKYGNVREQSAFSWEHRESAVPAVAFLMFSQLTSIRNIVFVYIHSKAVDDFGDRFTITQILDSAGLDLGGENKPEPSDWRAYYKERHLAMAEMNKDPDTLIAKSEKDYDEAQELLKSFQSTGDVDALSKAAQLNVRILGKGCFENTLEVLIQFAMFAPLTRYSMDA